MHGGNEKQGRWQWPTAVINTQYIRMARMRWYEGVWSTMYLVDRYLIGDPCDDDCGPVLDTRPQVWMYKSTVQQYFGEKMLDVGDLLLLPGALRWKGFQGSSLTATLMDMDNFQGSHQTRSLGRCEEGGKDRYIVCIVRAMDAMHADIYPDLGAKVKEIDCICQVVMYFFLSLPLPSSLFKDS